MAPHDSPYWNEIVRGNWPEIGPGTWSGLETATRTTADNLDLHDVGAARRNFDDRVRFSGSLQPIKDGMRTQQGNLGVYSRALTAAADTFGDMSSLVYRTRHRILDIVDAADSRIRKAQSTGDDDDRTEEQRRTAVSGIISRAAAEVDDVVAAARKSVSPQGMPGLSLIADLLGVPGPWTLGSGPGVGPGHGPHGTRSPRGHLPGQQNPLQQLFGDPRLRQPGPLPVGSGPRALANLLLHLLDPGAEPLNRMAMDPAFPDQEAPSYDRTNPGYDAGPASGYDRPGYDGSGDDRSGDDGYSPRVSAPADSSGYAGPVPGRYSAGNDYGGGAGPESGGYADQDWSGGGPTEPTEVAAGQFDPGEYEPGAPGGQIAAEAGGHQIGGEPSAGHTGESAELGAPEGVSGEEELSPLDLAAGIAAAGLAAPIGHPAVFAPPSDLPAAAAGAAPGTAAAAAAAGTAAAAAHPGSDPRAAQSAGPKITAPGAVGSPGHPGPVPVAGTPGKAVPPGKDVTGHGARSDEDQDGADGVRAALGAAMIAAATPAFLLGERVNGDFVLARTLLSGILAALDDSAMGPDWAVAVLRHPGGLSAFVTSTEGRGWLPTGLYLPREVSTPWLWEVSVGSGWEGVADPARILAEFTLAWGARSGARLAALVSSQPIDPKLRAGFGEVPMEGEVGPGTEMNLAEPGPGLVDRLGLAAAQPLLDRVENLPADAIARRCREFARDGHVRVGRTGQVPVAALDVPGIRQRILDGLRRGRPVPAEHWEQLRDADALLAATTLTHRLDVSRIPLGELRSEQDSRVVAELAALRALTFQRRCNELVLFLAEDPSRQVLRDVVYAHGQLTEHPALSGTSTPPDDPAAHRSAISTGRF
ncbi:hypothetical protein [Nocardia aurantia]|uniref:Uncharacterized protein n=1 Tax=Nocardia aurantia TaxID=2585199 RepID=A0A7K0DTS1_9NOCA|nr:hypothetical protein [Nocardia aurantia]MQY28224.1 hypothetical protein [Nocardia aurantia]